jgi:hypothetical protein
MGQFAKIVEPKDLIEWWWSRTLSITVGKSGAFKVFFIELGRDMMHLHDKMRATVLAYQDDEYENRTNMGAP